MNLFKSFRKGTALYWLFIVLFAVLFACPKHNPTDPEDSEKIEKLSFFEEQLVGLWSRYHSYDGSSNYVRFNADRTACAWEEASGSDLRTKNSSYSYWEIDEDNPINENRFKVIVEGAGIYYTFDYTSDNIWPQNYSTYLKYYRSSEGKMCE